MLKYQTNFLFSIPRTAIHIALLKLDNFLIDHVTMYIMLFQLRH